MGKLRTLSAILLTLSGCATAPLDVDRVYVIDLQNDVCVEYEIVDREGFRVMPSSETFLSSHSPCDRLIGFRPWDFKKVQKRLKESACAK